MDLKSTYNKIAEDWSKDHATDTWWQEGTDKFLSLLPKESTVLDVGCGGGIKSNYIAGKGYRVTGIDFSEKMIEVAHRKFPKIDFDVVDIYMIDKYQKMFDGIFAQAVLLHIPKNKVMEVLEKIKDKLKPCGLLYIGVKKIKDGQIEDESIKKENDYGYEYERFFSYFTPEELKNYMKQLDMEIVWEGVTTSGRADWIQIIGKKK